MSGCHLNQKPCEKNICTWPRLLHYFLDWHLFTTSRELDSFNLTWCSYDSTSVNRFASIWAAPWENVSYVICEPQRRRSACAFAQSDQRLCFSLLRQYNISRFYSRNFKTLASFCGCAGRFVSGLVGNSRRYVLSCHGSFINSWTTMQMGLIRDRRVNGKDQM